MSDYGGAQLQGFLLLRDFITYCVYMCISLMLGKLYNQATILSYFTGKPVGWASCVKFLLCA